MDKEKRAEIAYAQYKESKKRILEDQNPPPGITKAKLYFPVTKVLLRLISVFEHSSISFLNERRIKTPKDRPVIYACTHKFKPDIERISLSFSEPTFLIASDFKNSYKTIAGWYFNTRPTIFVDPYDKEDKNRTYQLMVKYLKAGHACMIFPEAVWNLSENRIILNCFLGTVRAALETNAVIICNAIERYDNKYIINRQGYLDMSQYVKDTYGQYYNEIPNEKKKIVLLACNRLLRDSLATRMMEIWFDHADKNGIEKRADLPNGYWSEFLNKLTSEWPGYKMSDNVEQQYYTKAELEFADVHASFDHIIPSLQSAFLFNKRLKE